MENPAAAPAPLQSRDWLALLFAMFFPTLATWLYFVVLAGQPAMQPAYWACKVIQFGFPVVWVWCVQRQRLRISKPTTKGLAWGAAFGLLVLISMMALYYAKLKGSSALRNADEKLFQKLNEIGWDTPGKFIALGIFLSVLHAFLEEYYWRWFVFGQLRGGVPVAVASVFSSLAFAAHHVVVLWTYMPNWTATVVFSLGVAAGGAVWAWIYQRSNSLLGSWLSHVMVDAGLMWIGFDLCRRFWE